ncbi:hypothetical protein [Sphingomonas sp. GB1N7]|uniref:hypothetical protein n=1 Tax=Parasphingomonas caseinilytica TaxID=3096158 RepID=UPI002FCA8CA9
MSQTSGNRQRSAFSGWLRTGKLPPRPNPDGLEFKFNPWHDPADGKFTFAGSGRHYGAGGANAANRASGRIAGGSNRAPSVGHRNPAPIAAAPKAQTPRTGQSAGSNARSTDRGSVKVPRRQIQEPPLNNQTNRVTELVGGFGEKLYDVAEGTAKSIYSVMTTPPTTTGYNVVRGLAGMIDSGIAAEDVPARRQVARAADAVANASARDVGRALGSVVGNVAVTVATGATGAGVARVSNLSRLRAVRPRATYDPPQIGWAKENVKSDKLWKAYNDSAPGARSGQAPTLMRTMPNGSKRPVKFDGVQGDYVIDRKWGVRDAPRALAQLKRQSEVLAQHRVIGIWEVPTPALKVKALKILKKHNVTNIKVKVVKP